MSDLLLVWMSPSVSPSPSEPSPSCWAVVVLMAPVLELILPGPAGWPSTAVSPYALLRPDTVYTNTRWKQTAVLQMVILVLILQMWVTVTLQLYLRWFRLWHSAAYVIIVLKAAYDILLLFWWPTTVFTSYRIDCRTSTLWAHTATMLSWGGPQCWAISCSCAALIIWRRGWNYSNSCNSKYTTVTWPGYI